MRCLVQSEERSRLELEAEQGRRWGLALEVWREFIESRRREVLGVLEAEESKWRDVSDHLATLRILKAFEDEATTRVAAGEFAERKMRDGTT